MKRNPFMYFIFGCATTLAIISIPKCFYLSAVSKRKVAVFFGDSITQHGFDAEKKGWVASMGHFWARKVDIINRGFSGYNSRWGLSIVDAVLAHNPQLVVIFFGANDAVVKEGETFVPLEEFTSNIEKIVLTLMKVNLSLPISLSL
jgi:lysophospholipase L1-like esterase